MRTTKRESDIEQTSGLLLLSVVHVANLTGIALGENAIAADQGVRKRGLA